MIIITANSHKNCIRQQSLSQNRYRGIMRIADLLINWGASPAKLGAGL
jgi:hypothetical protein